jgi:hypothetical protein
MHIEHLENDDATHPSRVEWHLPQVSLAALRLLTPSSDNIIAIRQLPTFINRFAQQADKQRHDQ